MNGGFWRPEWWQRMGHPGVKSNKVTHQCQWIQNSVLVVSKGNGVKETKGSLVDLVNFKVNNESDILLDYLDNSTYLDRSQVYNAWSTLQGI